MPSTLLKGRLSDCCTLSADRAREGSFTPAAIGPARAQIREQSALPPGGRGHSATLLHTRPRSSQRRVKWSLCLPTLALRGRSTMMVITTPTFLVIPTPEISSSFESNLAHTSISTNFSSVLTCQTIPVCFRYLFHAITTNVRTFQSQLLATISMYSSAFDCFHHLRSTQQSSRTWLSSNMYSYYSY